MIHRFRIGLHTLCVSEIVDIKVGEGAPSEMADAAGNVQCGGRVSDDREDYDLWCAAQYDTAHNMTDGARKKKQLEKITESAIRVFSRPSGQTSPDVPNCTGSGYRAHSIPLF